MNIYKNNYISLRNILSKLALLHYTMVNIYKYLIAMCQIKNSKKKGLEILVPFILL